jgi:hypothetical protein
MVTVQSGTILTAVVLLELLPVKLAVTTPGGSATSKCSFTVTLQLLRSAALVRLLVGGNQCDHYRY